MGDIYNSIAVIFYNVTNAIVAKVYSTTLILYKGVIPYLFVLFILVWTIKKISTAEHFSLKDLYPSVIFTFTFIVVEIILLNEKIYYFFLEDVFQYPRDALSSVVIGILNDTKNSTNPNEIIKTLITSISTTQAVLDQADGGWFDFNFTSKLLSVVFWIVSLVLIILVCGITIVSTLLARILISFFGFMLPFVLWSKTRGYFAGWLRTYISFSLYAPLAVLFASVAVQFGTYSTSIMLDVGKNENIDLMSFMIVIVGFVLCIYFLLKIPNLVNGVVGSSNDSMTGASGIIGFAGGYLGGKLQDLMKGAKGKAKELMGFGKDKGGNKNETINPMDESSAHS